MPTNPLLNQRKLDGIQILRLLAALSVLLQHAVYLSGTISHIDVTQFLDTDVGGFGVCLLFFISGFMMMLQIHKPAYEFALHRIFRIYPPFFVSLLLSFLIAVPVLGFHYFRFHIRLDFLLVPTGSINPTFNVPYWTLIYEVFFYILVFLIIFFKTPQKILNLLLIFWATLVILIGQFHPVTNYLIPNIFQIGISPMCIFLIMGAATGLFYQKKSKVLLPLLIILILYFAVTPINFLHNMVKFVFISLLLFYLAIKFDNIRFNKFFTSTKNIMVHGGDYTYGLYLLHLSLLMTICHAQFFMRLPYWQQLTVATLIAGVVGLIYGYIEYNFYAKKLRVLANTLAADFSKKLAAKSLKNRLLSKL